MGKKNEDADKGKVKQNSNSWRIFLHLQHLEAGFIKGYLYLAVFLNDIYTQVSRVWLYCLRLRVDVSERNSVLRCTCYAQFNTGVKQGRGKMIHM